jgi:hypothetical protein
MVPWREVWRRYSAGQKGIHIDEFDDFPQVSRISGEYNFSENIVEMFT